MPIWIDNRGSGEKELFQLLEDKHLAVEQVHLGSGDIAFGDVSIERKTVSDLVGSVVGSKKRPHSRHFWDQLKVLKNTYKIPLMIIEGNIDYKDKLVSGIIFSLTLDWKIQWIHTYNLYDTAEAIARLFTKYGSVKASGYPPSAVRKEQKPKRIRWAMLQCIRGIGPVTASKILKELPYICIGSRFYSKFSLSMKGTLHLTYDHLWTCVSRLIWQK